MALINNNKIKKIRLKQFCQTGYSFIFQFRVTAAIRRTGKLLVQREIHLVGSDSSGIVLGEVDLMNRFLQWLKVLVNGLIHQIVAVCKIQDFSFQPTFQKAVNNLECGISFACSGGHYQQNPLLTSCNRFDRSIDGILLIVAGRISALAGIVRLMNDPLFINRYAVTIVCFAFPSGCQFFRGRESI